MIGDSTLGDTAEGLMRAVAYLLSASDGTYDLSYT